MFLFLNKKPYKVFMPVNINGVFLVGLFAGLSFCRVSFVLFLQS